MPFFCVGTCSPPPTPQTEPLFNHLEENSVTFLHFAFRWVNCLLMREIPLPQIIRMWDTYLVEDNGFAKFHIYVCAAFLRLWKDEIMSNDFQGIILFFQNLPNLTQGWTNKNIEELHSEAYMLQVLFGNSPNHLRGPQAT